MRTSNPTVSPSTAFFEPADEGETTPYVRLAATAEAATTGSHMAPREAGCGLGSMMPPTMVE
jgi:hypothetical protein